MHRLKLLDTDRMVVITQQVIRVKVVVEMLLKGIAILEDQQA